MTEWRTEPLRGTTNDERARGYLYVVGPKEHGWLPPAEWLFHADDARLIAAAPDLLEACRAVVRARDVGGAVGVWQCRAAIAKATGGSTP